MNIDPSPITALFATVGQRDRFLTNLYLLSQSLYRYKTKLSTAVDKLFPEDQTEALINYLKADKQDAKKQIDQLVAYLTAVPVVTIAAAYIPTSRVLSLVGEFLSKALKKKAFVQFQLDNSIVAGAKIYFQGQIKDYSYI